MLLCPICERGSIAVSSVSMSAKYFLRYNCPIGFSPLRIVQAWCRISPYFVPYFFFG